MMRRHDLLTRFLAALVALAPARSALADPCGMVPPIRLTGPAKLERVGLQKTYVFFQNGVESLVLRPGFTGSVEEFGMLIPFPAPPAIRKVADDVFPHIAAAIDPPEVVVDLTPRPSTVYRALSAQADDFALGFGERRERDQGVRVLRQEAVGMYEVAVLDAGSTAALREWMGDHGFRYPDGMEDVCDEYIEERWCFVAVKARVADKSATDPRPGLREVDPGLPPGSTFDGHVQAMGFRFRTDELVVPMRLSAFNEGELRNVVYVLSDEPLRVANLDADMVVRQVSGHQVFRNLTDPLPLRIIGGELADVPAWRKERLPRERDPEPHNGIAAELFASDLLAVRTGLLTHPVEEREKELLDIGERLGLRGPELDALHAQVLAHEREETITSALRYLEGMTLSVIDGDFPRDVLAAENLRFAGYSMPLERNRREVYDAKLHGAGPLAGGGSWPGSGPTSPLPTWLLLGALAVGLSFLLRRRALARPVVAAGLGAAVLVALSASTFAGDQDPSETDLAAWIAAASGGETMIERGRAIVRLGERSSPEARAALRSLQSGTSERLIRVWCLAALALKADPDELSTMAHLAADPVLARPLTNRWLALLADPDTEVSLETVLHALAYSQPLQQACLPRLLERPTTEFLDTMLEAEGQHARNLAAAALATLHSQGREGLAEAVIEALRVDPTAEAMPWAGGPLFVPQLGWTKEQATALVRELVGWHLICTERGMTAEHRKIHNALNNWSLANAAGYTLPRQVQDSKRWLLAFGEIAGAEATRALLVALELDDHRIYRAVLEIVSDE